MANLATSYFEQPEEDEAAIYAPSVLPAVPMSPELGGSDGNPGGPPPIEPVATPAPVTPTPAPPAPPLPPAPTTQAEMARAYVEQGFGKGLSNEDLRRAQAEAASDTRRANILEAIGGIGAAITRQRQDPGFWNRLREQAGQPVQDLMRRREAVTQETGRNRQLQDDARQAARRDPNSPESRRLQAAMRGLVDKGVPPEAIANLTVEDWEGAQGNAIRAIMAAQERAAIARDDRTLRRESAEDDRTTRQEMQDAELESREAINQADIESRERIAESRRRPRAGGRGSGGGGSRAPGTLRGYALTYFPSDSPTDQANRALYEDPRNVSFRNKVAYEYDTSTGMFAGRRREQRDANTVSPQARAAADKYRASREGDVQIEQRLQELQGLIGTSGDIPGQGAGAAMPNIGYQAMRAAGLGTQNADRALRIRGARDRLLEQLLRKATGAAAPDSEKAQYRALYESVLGASDEDLRAVLQSVAREMAAIERNRRIGIDAETSRFLASTGAPGFEGAAEPQAGGAAAPAPPRTGQGGQDRKVAFVHPQHPGRSVMMDPNDTAGVKALTDRGFQRRGQ